MKLVQALQGPFLVGDGANGTVLASKGFTRQPYDLANLFAPELVRATHQEYFAAGSDLVQTNTFSASRIRLSEHNVDVPELNFAGAALARQAAGSERIVLGSIGPVGKPIVPIGHITEEEVFAAVREQAEALAEGGVDGFILETYIDLNEMRIAVQAVRSVCSLPIIVTKAFIEDGEQLAEGLPGQVALMMSEMQPVALGANCIVGPQRMLDIVRMIGENTNLPIVAQPTPGMPQLVKGQIAYDTSPDYFARAVARLVEEGARYVGGCCGTTPEHIRQLKDYLKTGKVKVKPKSSVQIRERDRGPIPESEPSELSRKLGKKFLTAVEMDLPRGLNLAKLLSGARSLKIAGCDLINISDGARARLRMNPMSVCSLIQSQVGIETTMHFSCRDRNLLAVQADLLGSHALGIRNILAVTGDPATIGDYPRATSVFDIDAIGLIRILHRFNDGIDLAGNSVGMKTAFTICGAFNPTAMEAELEFDRLKRKAEAGVQVIYTQPVFDLEDADRALEDCAKFNLPCFVGVLPLRNLRHCEFMHNEVPGIRIPDWLRKKMSDAPDDVAAQAVGLEEAMKLAAHVRQVAQGLYLMPPAGNHTIAEQIVTAMR